MSSSYITKPLRFPALLAIAGIATFRRGGILPSRSTFPGKRRQVTKQFTPDTNGFDSRGRLGKAEPPRPRSSNFSEEDSSIVPDLDKTDFLFYLVETGLLRSRFMDLPLSAKEAEASKVEELTKRVEDFFQSLSQRMPDKAPGLTLWPLLAGLREKDMILKNRLLMSVSVSIYKSIIAQEKVSGGSVQSQDLLKQKYNKSFMTLEKLLIGRDDQQLNERIRAFEQLMEANGDVAAEQTVLETNQDLRELWLEP